MLAAMRLTDEEQAMLAGEFGEPRRWAMTHQIAVGEFFDAEDFVPVSQAHIMADTEALGEAGVCFPKASALRPGRSARSGAPTITEPRDRSSRFIANSGRRLPGGPDQQG